MNWKEEETRLVWAADSRKDISADDTFEISRECCKKTTSRRHPGCGRVQVSIVGVDIQGHDEFISMNISQKDL